MEMAVALGSILVGLGGVAVAGGGLIVAHRTLKMTEAERAAGLRLALYEAQAAAIVELSAAVSSFSIDASRAIRDALRTRPGALDDDERKQVTVAMGPSFATVSSLLFRYWAVLPSDVVDALNVLLDAFSAITASTSERPRWLPEQVSDPDPVRLMQITGTNVIRAMRLALGTDPLTQQTLDRIGRAPG